MLLNTDISIALKNFYGYYSVNRFSLFETNRINKDFTSLEVKVQNNREVIIKVKCPVCGKDHYYRYSVNEFVRRKLIVGGCEVLGEPLFYIGKYDKVNQKINQLKNVNRKLYAMI
ncbi:hypothetical protein [Clostridium magnum]|uniref:Uncharacterized protein n=1 Tax=Clostridium magnum DSM 2767 TaxID=1121326 RepID=A0A162RL43_9CLOT|nr:hypothetical protein [Clostridium magnum]KZL90069.1 hypothetical protein CLMAG_45550 [Clostridium magnum DSM 2767]SHH59335.1 hypothetical protein SAMN02745944_00931 [Clostridium magnum DSM 2767]